MYQIEQVITQFESREVKGFILSHTEYHISYSLLFKDRDFNLRYTSLREAYNKLCSLNPSTIDDMLSKSRKADERSFSALIISKLIKNKWFLGSLYHFPDSTLAWKPCKEPLPIRKNTRRMDIETTFSDNLISMNYTNYEGLKWNQRFVYDFKSKEQFLLEDTRLHLYLNKLYLSTENLEHTFRHSNLFTYPDPNVMWDVSSDWNNIVKIKREAIWK